jgi:hypothetical protein
MKKNLRKPTMTVASIAVSVAVVVTVAVVFALWLSNRQEPTNDQGGITMASEETIQYNTAVLLKHFEGIEYDDSWRPREGLAEDSAYSLGKYATKNRIVKVSSSMDEHGDFVVTVTDDVGALFILRCGKFTMVSMIEDEEGAVVYLAVM